MLTDSAAAQAVERHHAAMQKELTGLVASVREAVLSGVDVKSAQATLVAYLREELVPHAAAEEKTLYQAAAGIAESRLLIESMVREHAAIIALVDEVAAATDPRDTMAAARAVLALFQAHLAKENDQVLPVLLHTGGVSVAAMLEGMHEILGESETEDHGCDCGHDHDDAAQPSPAEPVSVDGRIDVRTIPHHARHETIFRTFGSLAPGQAFVIVADHDPRPLRYQFEAMHGGEFGWEYLEQGPQTWQVRVSRTD